MQWGTSGFSLGAVLFNNFINEPPKGIEMEFTKFAGGTKQGRIANTLEERLRIQKNLNRLEHWALFNKMQFRKVMFT